MMTPEIITMEFLAVVLAAVLLWGLRQWQRVRDIQEVLEDMVEAAKERYEEAEDRARETGDTQERWARLYEYDQVMELADTIRSIL